MDRLLDILNKELRPNETVLWRGQPVPNLVLIRKIKRQWPYFMVLVLFLTISIGSRSSPGFLAPLSIIVVISILARPFKTFVNCKKWLYVVTNQRILVIEIRKEVIVTSYSKEEIFNSGLMKKFRADGIGDVLFRGRRVFGFVAISNAQEVAALVEKTFMDRSAVPPVAQPQQIWSSTQKIQ